MYPINIACADPIMRRRSIDYFKRGVQFCHIMNCPLLLVTPGKGYFDQPVKAAWGRCIEALREIGEYAASAGVKLAVEHLTRLSTNIAVTAAALAALVKEVGLPNVGGMVDTDMAGRCGESVGDYLSAFEGKLAHVHLVDGMPGGHMVPGDGVLALKAQMEQLSQFGYRRYITPEIMHSSYQLEPEKALERTVRWMESVFAGI